LIFFCLNDLGGFGADMRFWAKFEEFKFDRMPSGFALA